MNEPQTLEYADASGRTRTSGLAIAALVLGICALPTCGVLGLPGLVLGIVALVKIGRSQGRIGGNGLAIAGTVLSGLSVLVMPVMIAVMIAILMPALSRARSQALQVSCGSNMRQLAYASLAYANDNGEQLPTKWSQICTLYLKNDFDLFVSPLEPNAQAKLQAVMQDVDRNSSYVLIPGLKASDPPNLIVAYSLAPGPTGEVNVARLDARVVALSPQALQQQLTQQNVPAQLQAAARLASLPSDAEDLKQLCFAALAHANANSGRLPTKWSQIRAPRLENEFELFVSVLEPDRESKLAAVRDDVDANSSYALVPGLESSDPPDFILAYSLLAAAAGQITVIRIDTRQETISAQELQKRLAEQKKSTDQQN